MIRAIASLPTSCVPNAGDCNDTSGFDLAVPVVIVVAVIVIVILIAGVTLARRRRR